MSEPKKRQSWLQRHGNIFTPHAGSMIIHVQRESGLAHRTMVLRPWQVKALRVLSSRWFLSALAIGIASWGYLAMQAARVPLLQSHITRLEQDAKRLDTLQQALSGLQARYAQVQRMLSAPGRATGRDARGSQRVEAAVKGGAGGDSASAGAVPAAALVKKP